VQSGAQTAISKTCHSRLTKITVAGFVGDYLLSNYPFDYYRMVSVRSCQGHARATLVEVNIHSCPAFICGTVCAQPTLG